MLINGRKNVGIENSNPKEFIDYSQAIGDVYENLEGYNPTKKRRVLIVFHDMIADMESNKKLNPIATELFLRRRKLNISLVFISQSCFNLYKTKCNMKIPNKGELQQTASIHLSEINFKYFMKLYKGYTKEQYSCLVNDTTLSSHSPL